jgi:hypothetical protein
MPTRLPRPQTTGRQGSASGVRVDCASRFPNSSSTHFILRVPSALSIGHGFGGIPAPCSFGSSAFPFPPKKSPGTTQEIFRAPPEMQTLALGADPSRFRVPQLRGQKKETEKMYENRVELMGFLGKNPESKLT